MVGLRVNSNSLLYTMDYTYLWSDIMYKHCRVSLETKVLGIGVGIGIGISAACHPRVVLPPTCIMSAVGDWLERRAWASCSFDAGTSKSGGAGIGLLQMLVLNAWSRKKTASSLHCP